MIFSIRLRTIQQPKDICPAGKERAQASDLWPRSFLSLTHPPPESGLWRRKGARAGQALESESQGISSDMDTSYIPRISGWSPP